MFVTAKQFYIFLACVSLGVVLGVIYSLVSPIKKLVKLYPLAILLDIIFFVFTAFCYVKVSYEYNFPSLRFYMIIGVFVGVIGYIKSFNIILAKLVKKVYNICIIKRRKNIDERRKI